MKLIYIHQHFMTNKGSGGTRSYDVAKYMLEAGHRVTMITGRYENSNLPIIPFYKLFERHDIDGIEVIICNIPYSNKMNVFKRYLAFIWFAIVAIIAGLTVKKPDIVFATSTPLTVGIPGYIVSKIKRVPFVFEVRDVWPESFIESGWVTGEELSIRIMAKLEKFCYGKATKILLVSKGFEKSLINKGVSVNKIKTILLGADGNIFKNIQPNYSFVEKYNLKNKKIAIFTGAHGKANGLDYIVNAADCTRNRSDIAYVCIGIGSEKQKLIELSESKGLTNIIFANPVPKEQLVRILAVCNIGLMILKHNKDGYRPVTPNKIFDYMFIGIPSIVNFKGPTADMVESDNSGIYVDGTKPEELAQKVCMLVDNPNIAKEMGENGKKAALEKYDRKIIADQLIQTFQQILNN